MIVKRISTGLISLFILNMAVFGSLTPELFRAEAEDITPEEAANYYTDIFTITAYYSPLPGQSHYVTGSYESDIRLNGNGTNGADGTPVYPGMVAAPKKYAFGTKLNIPGIGIVAVHDRGGAIVESGQRGQSYDRLDIWMGYGDAGLQRALNWGKRTVQVTVYGQAPEVSEQIYLEGYSEAEKFVQTVILNPLNFPNDIYYGTEGAEVTKMQQYLMDWGYLTETTGFYGEATAQAIYMFQLDNDIVSSSEELGAGHFGINTRKKFDEYIKNGVSEENTNLLKGRSLMNKFEDLKEESYRFSRSLELGDSGEDVTKLQQELASLGFLRTEASGYFGEVTEHALFKFQQSRGIIEEKTDQGAGYFGPKSRETLNNIIATRFDTKSLLAYKREEVLTGRHLVKLNSAVLARQ